MFDRLVEVFALYGLITFSGLLIAVFEKRELPSVDVPLVWSAIILIPGVIYVLTGLVVQY